MSLQIDLNEELERQLDRCRTLANDAEEDGDSPLSQRATALSAMSSLLRELTKSQLEVINMARLQALEQTIIELLNEVLTQEQIEEFITKYEQRPAILEQRESQEN